MTASNVETFRTKTNKIIMFRHMPLSEPVLAEAFLQSTVEPGLLNVKSDFELAEKMVAFLGLEEASTDWRKWIEFDLNIGQVCYNTKSGNLMLRGRNIAKDNAAKVFDFFASINN